MEKIITISQIEYKRLNIIAKKYEIVRKVFSHDLLEKPAIQNSKQIIKDFRKTGLYNQKFLKSLKQGLEESDYFA